MKGLFLVGGLIAAAAVIALLVWPRAAAPVDVPAPAAVVPAPAAASPPSAPAAAAKLAPPPSAPAAAAVDDPQHPGVPPGAKQVVVPAPAPFTKQEKLNGLGPLVPDLEEKVAWLRKQADDDEHQGNLDAAKLKRVAADCNEKRLGEIKAALAEGKLPPGFVNPTSTDKSKE